MTDPATADRLAAQIAGQITTELAQPTTPVVEALVGIVSDLAAALARVESANRILRREHIQLTKRKGETA